MKRYRINNMNIYEADPLKEMRFIEGVNLKTPTL